ncbi:MAG: hypothetical protein ACJ8BF_03425 [Gemmatimonadales bacterium]
MRTILALVVGLTASHLPVLRAQTDYYGRLGLTFTTDLVRDVIFQEIRIRPALAPTVVVGASLPMAPRYRVGLEAGLTTSGYHSKEGSTQTDLGTLRTGSIMLGLEGPIGWIVSWRGGVGLLHYWPTEESGIFLQGGPTRFLAGAGLDFRPKVMTNWDMMLSLRYDFHRFTTDELRARGFSGTQGVQRVSATVGLARGRR